MPMLFFTTMTFKTLLKVFLFWTGLISLYVSMLIIDGTRFKTGYQLTPAVIKTVLINIVLWTGLSVYLYQKIGQLIHQKSSLTVMAGFFLINLLWLPLFVFVNHWLVLFFTFYKVPSFTQVMNLIYLIYVYVVVVQYLFLFAICYGLQYQQHAFQIELESADNKLAFSDMKMQTLQSQLSPHFLYNSLSSISGLVRRNEPDKTLDLIADLGDLLRFSVAASKVPLIALQEEIHFTEKYIDLQRIRFGERFGVQLNVHTNQKLMCPPFILQTLVENAFIHSNQPKEKSQEIIALIKTQENELMIQVTNPLANNSEESTYHYSKKGMGLALVNLENRLSILFQDQYQINKQQTSSEFQTTIMIPKRTFEAETT